MQVSLNCKTQSYFIPTTSIWPSTIVFLLFHVTVSREKKREGDNLLLCHKSLSGLSSKWIRGKTAQRFYFLPFSSSFRALWPVAENQSQCSHKSEGVHRTGHVLLRGNSISYYYDIGHGFWNHSCTKHHISTCLLLWKGSDLVFRDVGTLEDSGQFLQTTTGSISLVCLLSICWLYRHLRSPSE